MHAFRRRRLLSSSSRGRRKRKHHIIDISHHRPIDKICLARVTEAALHLRGIRTVAAISIIKHESWGSSVQRRFIFISMETREYDNQRTASAAFPRSRVKSFGQIKDCRCPRSSDGRNSQQHVITPTVLQFNIIYSSSHKDNTTHRHVKNRVYACRQRGESFNPEVSGDQHVDVIGHLKPMILDHRSSTKPACVRIDT